MVIIFNCHWCNTKFEKKKKSNLLVRFCSSKCGSSHTRAFNKQRIKESQLKFRKNNLEKVRASKRKWNDENKDYRKLWYMAHKEEVKMTQLTGYRKQMHSRIQAKRIVKKLGVKKECVIGLNCNGILNLHHKDGNALNNKINNLEYLCRKHHMEAHILLNKLK